MLYKYYQMYLPIKKYIYNSYFSTDSKERTSCPNWTWMRHKYWERDFLSSNFYKFSELIIVSKFSLFSRKRLGEKQHSSINWVGVQLGPGQHAKIGGSHPPTVPVTNILTSLFLGNANRKINRKIFQLTIISSFLHKLLILLF